MTPQLNKIFDVSEMLSNVFSDSSNSLLSYCASACTHVSISCPRLSVLSIPDQPYPARSVTAPRTCFNDMAVTPSPDLIALQPDSFSKFVSYRVRMPIRIQDSRQAVVMFSWKFRGYYCSSHDAVSGMRKAGECRECGSREPFLLWEGCWWMAGR